MGALVLVALALVAGCDDPTLPLDVDAGVDAAADAAAPTCANEPRCPGMPDFECTLNDMICGCHSGSSFCHSTACPDVTFGESVDGQPCTTPGLCCDYGFESSILCVGPENRWVFCGPFSGPEPSALCCLPLNQPDTPGCVCGDDNHVHCNSDGGI